MTLHDINEKVCWFLTNIYMYSSIEKYEPCD